MRGVRCEHVIVDHDAAAAVVDHEPAPRARRSRGRRRGDDDRSTAIAASLEVDERLCGSADARTGAGRRSGRPSARLLVDQVGRERVELPRHQVVAASIDKSRFQARPVSWPLRSEEAAAQNRRARAWRACSSQSGRRSRPVGDHAREIAPGWAARRLGAGRQDRCRTASADAARDDAPGGCRPRRPDRRAAPRCGAARTRRRGASASSSIESRAGPIQVDAS